MRNLLQDQLLKAGLVKKNKVAEVVRDQSRQRQAKGPLPPGADHVDARRLLVERAERDRARAAERNAQTHACEQLAQAGQIVESNKIKREGEIAYRFSDQGKIRSVLVSESLRAQLAKGQLVIARHGQGYELLPRSAADKVYARAGQLIVLDHANVRGETRLEDHDECYRQFPVPDDLTW